MSKKNKNKSTVKSDKTAFTKEEFYGKSRKSRRQRSKNKKLKNVSRETFYIGKGNAPYPETITIEYEHPIEVIEDKP